jgi:hypothetical protein
MEAMIKRYAGLDVHKETVVVCALTGELDKKPVKLLKAYLLLLQMDY